MQRWRACQRARTPEPAPWTRGGHSGLLDAVRSSIVLALLIATPLATGCQERGCGSDRGVVPAGWGARDRDLHFLYCDPDTLVLESTHSGILDGPDLRPCIDTGCLGDLCLPVFDYSECDVERERRARCYRRHARCERHGDSTCGWIEVDGMLEDCLASPPDASPDTG